MTRARPPIRISELRIRRLDPNFTAVLPGKCQARCSFCIEPEGPTPPSPEVWLQSFESLVGGELPGIFRTVSISGGEPSLSPVFASVLEVLARYRGPDRLRRAVLTTNGNVKGLTRHLDAIGRAITHINISRHAVDDLINARVFHTTKIPGRGELADLISQFNRLGIPVNLNCVYSEEHAFGTRISGMSRRELRAEAKRYISFARELGASSVVFRYDHRNWSSYRPTALEAAFDDYAVLHHAQCASCHVVGKVIRGLAANFKQSAYEPMDLHGLSELYELVLHSDAGLYLDWSRRHPVERPLPRMQFTEQRWEILDAWSEAQRPFGTRECREPDARCGLLTAVPEPDGHGGHPREQ